MRFADACPLPAANASHERVEQCLPSGFDLTVWSRLGGGAPVTPPALEIADLMRTAEAAFVEQNRQWIRWRHEVLPAIARCRKAALGGHVQLLSPEPAVVKLLQLTRVEEPTLLCNHVGKSGKYRGLKRELTKRDFHDPKHRVPRHASATSVRKNETTI